MQPPVIFNIILQVLFLVFISNSNAEFFKLDDPVFPKPNNATQIEYNYIHDKEGKAIIVDYRYLDKNRTPVATKDSGHGGWHRWICQNQCFHIITKRPMMNHAHGMTREEFNKKLTWGYFRFNVLVDKNF